MSEASIENRHGKTTWIRFVVRTLALGVGIGIGSSLVLVTVRFYIHQPKRWDTRALRVKHAKAEALTLVGNDLSDKSTGTIFTVDVENKTANDVRLPQTVAVMQTD